MADTDWTSSWFGHRALIMEDLWSHQTLFGMLGSCSSFHSQPKLTQALRHLIVPLCQLWKHMTILRMAIINVIAIICIIASLDPVLFTPDFLSHVLFMPDALPWAKPWGLGIAMPLAEPMFYSCNYINWIYHCYYWSYGNYWKSK